MAFVALRWDNDTVQFARLLSEIAATQDLPDLALLLESMDLTLNQVEELFERAHQVWENAKVEADRCVAAYDVELDIEIPVALVQRGMMIDLEGDPIATRSCPESWCSCADMWAYEYGRVGGIEWETPNCVRLDFDNGVSIGFPPEHIVKVNGRV